MEKTTFVVPESDSTFTGPQIELLASMGVETPFQYFKQFVMDNMPEGCKGSLKPAVRTRMTNSYLYTHVYDKRYENMKGHLCLNIMN